jgi:hypothetical protein
MRTIFVSVLTQALVLTFAISASAAPRFPRTAQILVNEGGRAALVDLSFAVEIAGSAYYWAGTSFPNEAAYGSSAGDYARLTPGAGGVEVTIERPYERQIWQATVTPSSLVGISAPGRALLMPAGAPGKDRETSAPTGVAGIYWYDWDLAPGQAAESTLTLTATTPLLLAEGHGIAAHDLERAVGTAEYHACDGCEHADQLLVSDGALTVNLATLDFGKYSDFGCEGTRHPWINQLLALEVPFNFEGEVTVITQDLWEGQFWTAVRGGKVGLGGSPGHPALALLSFLDSLDAEGAFVGYHDRLLLFRSTDRDVVVDLVSGQTIRRDR